MEVERCHLNKAYFTQKIFFISDEATIVGTAQSSVLRASGIWMYASKLIDGLGLDGRFSNENGCAHSDRNNDASIEWFSLELQAPAKITRVQIAPDMDLRMTNVRITIGPSMVYDPDEPLCLPEIPALVHQPGLQDYACNGDLHEGKFVKIARAGVLDLCEVKVFTLAGK